MTTPSQPLPPSEQELASLLIAITIGQDAVAHAIAREFVPRPPSHLGERSGVFLLAGFQPQAHLKMAARLAEELHLRTVGFDLSSDWGRGPALFTSGLRDSDVGSLADHVRAGPGLLVVLTNVEKAHPEVLAQIEAAWRSGGIRDHVGDVIPLGGTTFMLTTELASQAIGQMARHETDPDRLHVACLKMLLDEGCPASILARIDRLFCLRYMTPGEKAREQHRRLVEAVEEDGLQLAAGGIDARILIDIMDPPVGLYADPDCAPLADFDEHLADAKARGIGTVRLVLAERGVAVVAADDQEVGV